MPGKPRSQPLGPPGGSQHVESMYAERRPDRRTRTAGQSIRCQKYSVRPWTLQWPFLIRGPAHSRQGVESERGCALKECQCLELDWG